MTARKWLTPREFAARAGVSSSEIFQSARRGRIPSRRRNGRIFINADEALQTFAATVRHAGHLRAPQVKPQPPPAVRRVANVRAAEPARGGNGRMTIADARQVRENAQARAAELDLLEREGALVDAGDVEKEWRRLAILVRKAVLNIPDRLAPLLAAESDRAACWRLLDEECREILEGTSDEVLAGGDG